MRRGTWSVEVRDQPQRRACDHFFAEMYMSAAEHLAEQHLDIDNIDNAIAQDDGISTDSQLHTGEGGPLLDVSWDPDESLNTEALMATSGAVTSWPPRFLQHG